MQEHLLLVARVQARPAAAIGLDGLPWTGSAPGLEQLCGLVEEGLGMAVTFLVAMLLFIDQAGLAPGCGGAVPAEQVRASCVLAPRSTLQPVAWASCARGGR